MYNAQYKVRVASLFSQPLQLFSPLFSMEYLFWTILTQYKQSKARKLSSLCKTDALEKHLNTKEISETDLLTCISTRETQGKAL